MENIDLNLENYSYNDILNLFHLDKNFNREDLKKAKKIVGKVHPDKSKLDPKYFNLFLKAYNRLAKVYNFRKKRKQDIYNAEYDKNTDDMTSEADEILLKKIMKKKKGDFNNWFNEMFEKANGKNKSLNQGYGEWFSSNEDMNEESANSTKDFGKIFNRKKENQRALIVHKGIQDIEYGSGGFNINSNKQPQSYGSGIFSKLQYEDLKTAHVETVVPVTSEDYDNRPKYNSFEDLKRERDEKIDVVSVQESREMLQRKYERDNDMASMTAYNLIKQDEEAERSNQEWWRNLRQLGN
tara:strand:+ start:263 stop:1150 length:888 start_codon:yes stop_codon:yes gene_type:complete